MWKTGTCALGVLALVLASQSSVGQEPQPGAVDPGRFVWGVGISTAQGVQARVEVSRKNFTARAIVVTESGQIIWAGDESEPLMHGELANAVREIETISQRVRNGDLSRRLAALDDAERAVMRARRSLGPLEESGAVNFGPDADASSEIVTAGNGTIRHWSMNTGEFLLQFPLQRAGKTPTGEAYSAFAWAVTRVRQAPETKKAREALDEVEKSVLALRSLLWAQEAKKD